MTPDPDVCNGQRTCSTFASIAIAVFVVSTVVFMVAEFLRTMLANDPGLNVRAAEFADTPHALTVTDFAPASLTTVFATLNV